MIIRTPASLDRAALEDNEASEGALGNSFVDIAELVWRKLDPEVGNMTQQSVADELGMGRADVSNQVALRKIAPEAWKVIATTVVLSRSWYILRLCIGRPVTPPVAPAPWTLELRIVGPAREGYLSDRGEPSQNRAPVCSLRCAQRTQELIAMRQVTLFDALPRLTMLANLTR